MMTRYPHVVIIFDVVFVIACTTVVMITDGIPDFDEPLKVLTSSYHIVISPGPLGSTLNKFVTISFFQNMSNILYEMTY